MYITGDGLRDELHSNGVEGAVAVTPVSISEGRSAPDLVSGSIDDADTGTKDERMEVMGALADAKLEPRSLGGEGPDATDDEEKALRLQVLAHSMRVDVWMCG